MTPPAPADILRPLREATGALHEALDSRLPIARLDASLADYVDHLRALRPWLVETRQMLVRQESDALGAIAARIDRKIDDLDADLADADGADAATPAVGADGTGTVVRPDEPRAPSTPDTGFAWGLAYVVEGSQLGAAVMHKRLRDRLAPHPLRYFSNGGSTASVGAEWSAFVTHLGAALDNPDAVSAAQRGAVDGFERLIRGFGWPPRSIEGVQAVAVS